MEPASGLPVRGPARPDRHPPRPAPTSLAAAHPPVVAADPEPGSGVSQSEEIPLKCTREHSPWNPTLSDKLDQIGKGHSALPHVEAEAVRHLGIARPTS